MSTVGRHRAHRVLCGLAAGALTLGLAELLAGLLTRLGWSGGEPSPVLAVGAAFIDRTPAWLKDAAISAFGTHDKQVLGLGMAVVLVLLCAGVGLLLRSRLRLALGVYALLGAVGLLAVLTRPDAAAQDAVPTVAGTVAGLLLLTALADRLTAADSRTSVGRVGESGFAPDRRSVLVLAGGAAVFGAVAAAGGRWIATSRRAVEAARERFVVPRVADPVRVPGGAEIGVRGVTPYVVPQRDFYRIDTALAVPQVDPGSWRLRVHGLVEREVEIDWETLLAKPMREAMVTLMCVSNEVGGSLNGNAIWTGWPVRELLKEAGVRPGADMVLSQSADGWTAGTPLRALTDDRNALIAVAMNREALTAEHGFPARLVVPGLYGYVSATKWLTELKVTRFSDDQGYWTPRGWSARGPVKTSSRIDVPQDGASVGAGTVAVAGVAWAQHTGITAVQVRVDDGPWQPARLGTDASIDVWRQWVLRWKATPGEHRITVRAKDRDGKWQTAEEAPPAPDGSSGHHRITVTVRS